MSKEEIKEGEKKDEKRHVVVQKKQPKPLGCCGYTMIVISIIVIAVIGVGIQMKFENPKFPISFKVGSMLNAMKLYAAGISEHSIFEVDLTKLEGEKVEAENKFRDGVKTIDFKIPALYPENTNDELAVRMYVTRDVHVHKEVAIMVYFHGGFFNYGNYSSKNDDAFCRRIARENRIFIISVDYRLAPEHPFPYAVEDTYAVLSWINDYNHPCLLGNRYRNDDHPLKTMCGNQPPIDRSNLILGGDGAGGNLAMTAYLLWKDRRMNVAPLQKTSNSLHHHRYHKYDGITVTGTLLVSPQVFEYPDRNSMLVDHYYLPKYAVTLFEKNYFGMKEMSDEQFAEERKTLFQNPFISPVAANLINFPHSCIALPEVNPYYDSGYYFFRLLIDIYTLQGKCGRFFGMPMDFLLGEYSETRGAWTFIIECMDQLITGQDLY